MELAGTSAIVTGGASGIGAASARALTKRGVRCVLIDLNDELGEALASELSGLYVKADVADPEQVQVAVDAALEMAPLRSLVNAAGIGRAGRTVDRDNNPLRLDYFESVKLVSSEPAFRPRQHGISAGSRQFGESQKKRKLIERRAALARQNTCGSESFSPSRPYLARAPIQPERHMV